MQTVAIPDADSTDLREETCAGPRSILVADDDQLFAYGLVGMGRETGVRVQVATDSTQLFRHLESQAFDHLVLEPNLPGRLWYSLLHGVREMTLTLPMTIATAFPSRALFRVAAGLGITQLLVKPLPCADVVHAVTTWARDATVQAARSTDDLSLALLEWEYINHTLRRCRGNVTEASRKLGLPRQTLYRKLRKHPPSR